MMEITGKVKSVSAIIQVSDSFQKRELVLVTDEQYPQTLLIEFPQDKGSLIAGLTEGESVTVHVNIRGREWKSPQGDTKYFTSLAGWKVGRGEATAQQAAAPAQAAPQHITGTDEKLPWE